MQDYIKYSQELADKYGEGASEPLQESAKVAALLFGGSNAVAAATEAIPKPSFSFSGGVSAPPAVPSVATSLPAAPAPFTFGAAPAVPAATTAPKPFQFGAAPAVPAADSAVPKPFQFGAFGSAPAGSSSFTSSFAFNPPATVSAPAAGVNSFSFNPPTSSALGAAPVTTAAGGDDENGGDEEGEPILEPEKVLRNETDTDDILLDVPCKLFGFSKQANEWKDTGKGSFRITRSADSKKQRMLVRNPIGKLTFNAAFYKSMTIEKVKGGLRFSAFVVVDEPTVGGSAAAAPKPELKNFMIKLKEGDIADALAKLEAGVASC